MSFSSAFVERRTSKNTFYKQINLLINWKSVELEISEHYLPGKNAVGQHAYSGILLFKMLLLGIWNGNLSDRATEELVMENLSAMRFCELCLEDNVPDHSVLSRFRSQLAKNGSFEKILYSINNQLEKQEIIIKTGIKVDATITDSQRKPKGKTTYTIAEDRKEDEVSDKEKEKQQDDIKLVKTVQPGVDTEARWVLKAGKMRYGYKEHVATDENGLIVAIETTSANEHDSLSFERLIEKSSLKPKTKIYADKAYKSVKHDNFLSNNKLKNRIHYKAAKNNPLKTRQIQFNKAVSKERYTVERTFGSISKWFKAGIARYIGKVKTHAQHHIEAIAYNLKRSPVLYLKAQIADIKLITG